MNNSQIIEYAKFKEAKEDLINWLEKSKHLKNNEVDIDEYEHIIDYLTSEDAPRLTRLSWKQAVVHAEKWIKKLNKQANDIIETKEDTETILDFGDGYRIVKLIGENAYKREGKLMRHCVASYYGNDKEIYSLRDKNNNPHCTMEKDQQIKGKGNGDISPKYIEYIVKFLEWSGMQVRDSEMEHLGYKRVQFPKYCLNNMFRGKYIPNTEEEIYDLKKVIIFKDIEKAVRYKGKRICLYSGDAYFRDSQIKSLGKLTAIGGSAYFRDSQIKSLGKLTTIGGYAYFSFSQVKSLGKLAKIGGDVYIENSNIKPEQLEKIKIGGEIS